MLSCLFFALQPREKRIRSKMKNEPPVFPDAVFLRKRLPRQAFTDRYNRSSADEQ